MNDINESAAIDWAVLIASDAWQHQLRPLLMQLREAALLRLMETSDEADIHHLRGMARAYDDLLNLPARALERDRRLAAEAEEQRRRQEELDERRRARSNGTPWTLRWGRRVRGAGPE
jgi:hypothetical protein